MTLEVRAPVALPPVQLFCLPHAGGTAALYRSWSKGLPAGVELNVIELPGHGARRAEAFHTAWAPLVEAICGDLLVRRDPSRPFAVFGHSMGAITGLELIHALRARGEPAPVWFGASGTVAPRFRVRESHWLGCTHDEMVERLRSLGGTPEALLADREFIAFLMPMLRADFHLCGTYPLEPVRAPLTCPVTVFAGIDDKATAKPDELAAWRDETHGACEFHAFPGGHFYLDAQPAPLLARVAASLARSLGVRDQAVSARSEMA